MGGVGGICSLFVGASCGLCLAILGTLIFDLYDFDQCTRKCRFEFRFHDKRNMVVGSGSSNERVSWKKSYMDNTDITGERNYAGEKDDGSTCTCMFQGKEIGIVERLYEPWPQGYPYPWKNTTVCGTDQIIYDSPEAAAEAGTKVINCGPCGSCSNVQDVEIYRKYNTEMSKMLARCALLHLFFAPVHEDDISRMCMQKTFPDMSPACLERFMDNFGCIIVHCKQQCIYKWNHVLSASPNQGVGDELSPCLLCDEMYCSPKFIETAGANRRCSGTGTDIKRPEREVCPYVNA